MATGGYTKKDINFFRSGSALLNVGAPTLRRLFEVRALSSPEGTTIEGFFQDSVNKRKIKRLNSRVLPKYQFQLLYPTDGTNPDVNTWDITLACCVLTNVCNLSSAEAILVDKIRCLRNDIYGHKTEASMEDAEFDRVWKELEETIEGLLVEINDETFSETMRSSMCSIKNDPLDVETGLRRELEIVLLHEDVVDRIGDLGEQISVLHDRTNDVANSLETMNLQMNSERENLHKKLQRILLDTYENLTTPVSPLFSEVDIDISDLYTDVSIYDVTGKQNFASSLKGDIGNRINTYHELFYTDAIRCQRRIFIVGTAGSGKSTYCLKLLQTWCEALKKFQSNSLLLSDDEKHMLEFDYLFYIPLSAVVSCTLVEDMLQEVLSHHDAGGMKEYIQECLTMKDRCLVILDGLDEWENHSDRHINNMLDIHCPTIVTTRHWTLVNVPRRFLNRVLEIAPMEEHSTRRLARNVLHNFYKISIDKVDGKVNRFIHEMKQNDLLDIVEIPVMLTYFVCLWYEDTGLDSSLSVNYGGILEHLIEFAERRDKLQSMETTTTGPEMEPLLLPGSMSFRKRCKVHSYTLYKLGCFALESLLGESHGTLVHDKSDLENRLGQSALKFGLKSGVLSQTRIPGLVSHTHFTVQFLHRSIQEFLAALWIASCHPNNAVDDFKRDCSIKSLLRLSKVFEFSCGLKPSLYNKLSNFAVQIASNSDEVQTYRHSLDSFYGRTSFRDNEFHTAKAVQDMLLMGFKEAKGNRKYVGSKQGDAILSHDKHIFYVGEIVPKCHIQDLIIIEDSPKEFVKDILQNNELKSLYVDSHTTHMHTELLENHILKTKSIERLALDADTSWLLNKVDDKQLRLLRSLTITLKNVETIPDSFQQMPHLSALSLSITGSHTAIEKLMTCFEYTTSLTELDIEEIKCTDEVHPSDECRYQIDLFRNKRLKKLSIDRVSKGSVLLCPDAELIDVCLHGRMRSPLAVLYCLISSQSLTHLTLGELLVYSLFEWDTEDVKAIVRVLPTLTALKYFHLMGIYFGDNCLVFSGEKRHLETVYLEDVHMDGQSWIGLLQSLGSTVDGSSRTNVLLSSPSIGNDVIHFINDSDKFEDVLVTSKTQTCIIRFDCR